MIVKRLYLNMENWSVSRGSYQLGYIAENQVTRLQIATEIDPNCTYHLEAIFCTLKKETEFSQRLFQIQC